MFINVTSAWGRAELTSVHFFDEIINKDTYDTTSCAIFTENLPTLVPPNFCTNHFAFGSMVFWCRFGGVLGGDDEEKEELLEDGGVVGGVVAGLVIEKR